MQARLLSAKTGGKLPDLSPISKGLCAKMIKADLMSCHVPLLRRTPRLQTQAEMAEAGNLIVADDQVAAYAARRRGLPTNWREEPDNE